MGNPGRLRLPDAEACKEGRSERVILIGNTVREKPPDSSGRGIGLRGERGDFTLTYDALSRGLLAVGSTGSGKTNLIKTLLSGVLNIVGQEDIVIIFDAKQDFFHRFFDAANPRHIVISSLPEHRKYSRSWNLFDELPEGLSPSDDGVQNALLELSAALFRSQESQQQPFFHMAARDVFRMVLTAFLRTAECSGSRTRLNNEALLDFLDNASTEQLLQMAGPGFGYIRSYLGMPSAPTPQSLGVEGVLHAMTASQFVSVFRHPSPRGEFSMRRLIREKGGRVIFLEHDLARGTALAPLISLLFDLAVREQLSCGRGNVWLFADELSVMPYVQRLTDACNLGRSQGVKTVVGLQSISMLLDRYGQERGNSIAAGFVNAACFKAVDAPTREYIMGRFGRTFELAAHGGTQFQHEGSTVCDADIRNLRPGEAFCDVFGFPPFRMRFGEFR